jgi:hypothetical protein
MSIIVQQDATSYSFYSLQTAQHVSGDTFNHHHQEREQTVITASGTDRTVCYLMMMGEGITRNMLSSLQVIKTVKSRILLDDY